MAPSANPIPPKSAPISPAPTNAVVIPLATKSDGAGSACALKAIQTGTDQADCTEKIGSSKQQRARLSALIHKEGVSISADHSATLAMLKVWHDLSSSDRDSLLTFAETLSAQNLSAYLPKLLSAKDDLGQLIITSKSTAADDGSPSKEKTSMIHELAAFATSKLDPALLPALNKVGAARGLITPGHPAATTADVIADLLDTIFHDNVIQGDSGTCASDAAEVILESLSPAEYTRLVRELFCQGSSKVANGDTMKRNDDGIQTDGGLDMVNAVMQGSLMDLDEPNHFRWNEKPDASGDHGSRDGKVRVYDEVPSWVHYAMLFPVLGWLAALITYLVKVPASDGTSEEHIAKTLAALTNKPYKVIAPTNLFGPGHMPATAADKIVRLKTMFPDGNAMGTGVIACCYWSAGGHAMRLDGVDFKSSPPALILRTWDLRSYQAGEQVSDFPGDVKVQDPAASTVRIDITDDNPVEFRTLVVPQALYDKK